jgi:type II secretory pathway pseudopilin PulG
LRVSSLELKQQAKSLSAFNWKLETGNWKLRARGFTLFELVVAIMIATALGTVFLERLRFYQEIAEKASMEATLRQIKTGLQIRLAELIIANRQGEAVQLEIEDPTRWLDTPPSNYAGLYREKPGPGAWYFDARQKQLVYVANVGDRLKLDGATGSKEIRFRARLLKDRVPVAGGTIESVTGVTLTPIHRYRWS